MKSIAYVLLIFVIGMFLGVSTKRLIWPTTSDNEAISQSQSQPRYTYDYAQHIDLRASKGNTHFDSTRFYKQRKVLKTIVFRVHTAKPYNSERVMKFEIELDDFPPSRIDSIIKAHAEIAKGKIMEMKIYDMAIDSNSAERLSKKEKTKP